PKREYLPETIEEKLVCYADKLVASSRVVPFERSLRKYSKLLGRDNPGIERMMQLHEEFGKYFG
ncbi:MAG: HD domain-containing protein, partial [Candidatus Geothermarchaeales archaeon]